MPVERSAGAVIFRRQGKKIYYLLLRYELGHWDYVKGLIEKGEKSFDTVIREAKEETGISDLKLVQGFKHTIRYFFRGKKVNGESAKSLEKKHQRHNSPKEIKGSKSEIIMKFVAFYLTQTKTKKIKLSYEHIGFKWLLYKEARERLTFKNAKKILDEANRFLTKSL